MSASRNWHRHGYRRRHHHGQRQRHRNRHRYRHRYRHYITLTLNTQCYRGNSFICFIFRCRLE